MTPHYTTTGARVLRNGQPFARLTSPEHADDVAAAMQRRADARADVVRGSGTTRAKHVMEGRGDD